MNMINIDSLSEEQVYIMYEVLRKLESSLEQKEDKSASEIAKLVSIKGQVGLIETWTKRKMEEKLHWTKEEVLIRYGHNPTLIIEFYPGTDGYSKFGREVVDNVEFSDVELFSMLENIKNTVKRESGLMCFKSISDSKDYEISTSEIFQISGRG